MEEENFDFSIEKALKKLYASGETRMHTQAVVAIDQIENLIKVKFFHNPQDLPERKRASYTPQVTGLLWCIVSSDQRKSGG